MNLCNNLPTVPPLFIDTRDMMKSLLIGNFLIATPVFGTRLVLNLLPVCILFWTTPSNDTTCCDKDGHS